MILLLPTNQGEHALHILSKDLSYIPVSVLLKSLRETEMLLQVPRFSIENKLDLRPALERVSLISVFILIINNFLKQIFSEKLNNFLNNYLSINLKKKLIAVI